jgi:hypothetical protein
VPGKFVGQGPVRLRVTRVRCHPGLHQSANTTLGCLAARRAPPWRRRTWRGSLTRPCRFTTRCIAYDHLSPNASPDGGQRLEKRDPQCFTRWWPKPPEKVSTMLHQMVAKASRTRTWPRFANSPVPYRFTTRCIAYDHLGSPKTLVLRHVALLGGGR